MRALFFCFPLAPAAFAQPDAPAVAIRIDAARVENHVSPRMYAAFVEMMAEDVKRGMTAEMLLDRSFEEPVDYLGLPAHWRLEPDERNDNVGAIKFEQSSEEAYPKIDEAVNTPNHSLRVTLAPADITDARRGFSEGRLSLRAGQAYRGYVWAKVPAVQGYAGRVRVALEEDNTDGATYAETTLPGMAGGWRRYDFTLTPAQGDRFGKLSFLFDGAGTIFLDQLSLEPADARAEIRPDAEGAIAALHPSFLRWPGGNVAQDYHWRWGVGPRDLRPIWINKAWSSAPEPDDLGTDEYLALCGRLRIEPSITVNVNGAGATPEEAAAWVQYVNGPADSKYGAMRAANGHPAPYGVKQWELGNEVFGGWVRGHATAELYAQEAVRYARAMRAVDPSLQFIAVGEGVFPNSDAWNRAVLRIAGADIDYLAIHDYPSSAKDAAEAKGTDPRGIMMSRPSQFEANYRHIAELIRAEAPNRPIRLIVNEWNLFYGADVIESMEGAVYASRMMNGFERDGDIVEANAISDLLNGWVGGILQASRDRVYGTPQYYAVQMYSSRLGTDRLHSDVRSPEIMPGTPSVDAVSTRAADSSRVFVKVSNADPTHPVKAAIDLAGFPYKKRFKMELLASPNSRLRNTFADPHAVAPVEKDLSCGRSCAVELPPDSVAVLTFFGKARFGGPPRK